MRNCYKIYENQFGKFFVKNHKYYYLDSFEVYGLDRKHWLDKIDYIIYNVDFIDVNGDRYIKLRKNSKLSKRFN